MSIAIAGNPRSGTSLTMLISLNAVGEDRIIGEKFGKLLRLEQKRKQGEEETEAHYKSRMLIINGLPENSKEALDKYVNMNPNGFYEHGQFTVRGIRFKPLLRDDIEMLQNEDKSKPYIIKLVNSGLFNSDPQFIDKVIYLLRHPFDVARSQIDLGHKNGEMRLKNGKDIDIYDFGNIEDAMFYMKATVQFARWRVNNPDIPVLFVNFDDLIDNPETELRRMADFTGEEGYMKGLEIIDPKLGNRHRVKHEARKGIWQEALHIHELCEKEDFQGIIDYVENPKLEYRKRQLKFLCVRMVQPVVYENCKFCRCEKDKQFIMSGIGRADINGFDWMNEPCIFECGFDPDDENPLTHEESIKNNHWKEVLDSLKKPRPVFAPTI